MLLKPFINVTFLSSIKSGAIDIMTKVAFRNIFLKQKWRQKGNLGNTCYNISVFAKIAIYWTPLVIVAWVVLHKFKNVLQKPYGSTFANSKVWFIVSEALERSISTRLSKCFFGISSKYFRQCFCSDNIQKNQLRLSTYLAWQQSFNLLLLTLKLYCRCLMVRFTKVFRTDVLKNL